MTRTNVTITLPPDVLAELDRQCASAVRKRSLHVEYLIRQAAGGANAAADAGDADADAACTCGGCHDQDAG